MIQPQRDTPDHPSADRYVNLPHETRKFIEDLHDDDVENLGKLLVLIRQKGMGEIAASLELLEDVRAMGKWSKWIAVSAVAVCAGMASILALWDRVALFFKGPHP